MLETINYKGAAYNYNATTNLYESASRDGSYIDAKTYKVFNNGGVQIDQYYPPLAAAPNMKWTWSLIVGVVIVYIVWKKYKK